MQDLKTIARLLESYKANHKSNWTMIRLYLKQLDRQESVSLHTKQATLCFKKIVELSNALQVAREEVTRDIILVA